MVWEVCDWPPPRLILKYGFPPSGGPTGRTREIEGIEFVELSPGYVRMGSHWGCDQGDWLGRLCATFGIPLGKHPRHRASQFVHECPTHWVEIHRPIWMSRGEITAGQLSLTRLWPDDFSTDHQRRKPKSRVTWKEAQWFCRWLGRGRSERFRLPGEHEWEYACRGGTSSLFWWGNEPAPNIADSSVNPWGLRDMTGSLSEWCSTPWSDSPSLEITGFDKPPSMAVFRGACDRDRMWERRSSYRHRWNTEWRSSTLGFRVLFTLSEDE